MERLRGYAGEYGLVLSDEMLAHFECYMRLLLDWNKKMNLTAITEPQEVIVKHFLDSLLLFQALSPEMGASMIDVGTGAGFPGIPAKIYRADLKLTLLDSLRKRVGFLQTVSEELGQDNRCVHGRAEELGRESSFREQYDLATARAVAALPALCEYCLPLVKPGGCFVALKGLEVEAECEQAAGALKLLGGALEHIHRFQLPEDYGRSLVVIRKVSQTPPKYPRIAAKITKNPL